MSATVPTSLLQAGGVVLASPRAQFGDLSGEVGVEEAGFPVGEHPGGRGEDGSVGEPGVERGVDEEPQDMEVLLELFDGIHGDVLIGPARPGETAWDVKIS